MVLYSRQVTTTGDGTALNVQFSSFSEIQLSDDITNHWKPQEIDLIYSQTNEDNFTTTGYTNFAILNKKSDQQTVPWKIVQTYGSLVAGAASNQLAVVFSASLSEATNQNYFLDVENPIVITNYPVDGVLATRTNGIYLLQATNSPQEVTFTFGPLMTGQIVDFNLLNGKRDFVANLNRQIVYPPNSSQTSTQGANGGRQNQQ
ncbi:MAG TPA: hypothetical protein VGH42_05190, partial [Verrucomicrobiae bacterium]